MNDNREHQESNNIEKGSLTNTVYLQKYHISGIFTRAININLKPKTEWISVLNEKPTGFSIFFQYYFFLALIPPLCFMTGQLLYGADFVLLKKILLSWSLVESISLFFSPLLALLMTAFILEQLPFSMNSGMSYSRFFQITGYSLTPFWLSGLLYLLPYLNKFALVGGFYSLFLLFTGFSLSLQLSRKRLVALTSVTAVSMILTGILFYRAISVILNLFFIKALFELPGF